MSVHTRLAGFTSVGLVVILGALSLSPAFAQTAPAAEAAQPVAAPATAAPKKSKRLDKHAPPWEVIWNSRLWTEAPPAQEFVQETHPDPKSLEYAPLIGKDPERPKPRDAAGIAALRAELEGDVQANAVRGKAVSTVGTVGEAAKPTKAPKSVKARRSKRTANAKPEATAAKAN